MEFDQILSQINEDLLEAVLILSSFIDDRLIEEGTEELRRQQLRETVTIAKSRLYERIERTIFNIDLLNNRLKKKEPFTKEKTILQNKQIEDYVFNSRDITNYVHRVLDDVNIVSDLTDLKELHLKFLDKAISFKEKIHEYNSFIINLKKDKSYLLMTIEEAVEKLNSSIKVSWP
jgi:predicted ATPase with chaperone activity